MPDETLLAHLQGNKPSDNKRHDLLTEKFAYYTKELKRVGVTRQILWEEYIRENPDGYSYSQFCYHFQIWQNLSEITMHMEHKAGDKLFVDFTGKKLAITDRGTGAIQEVEIFVAVLGASQLTYVEATMSQTKEDWIRVNENALRYIGGVPLGIVPDCLKSAVTKADRYEPDINPEYFDFARHYNTIFDTLRVMSFRLARGQHPFRADKTHLHHLMLRSGIPPRRTVKIIWFLSLLLSVLGFFLVRYDSWIMLWVLLIVALVIGVYIRNLKIMRKMRSRRTNGAHSPLERSQEI